MYISILLLFFNVVWSVDVPTNTSATFFSVKAMPGDGVYSILRRYELDQHSCNFKKFYTLNKLKRNAFYIPITLSLT